MEMKDQTYKDIPRFVQPQTYYKIHMFLKANNHTHDSHVYSHIVDIMHSWVAQMLLAGKLQIVHINELQCNSTRVVHGKHPAHAIRHP